MSEKLVKKNLVDEITDDFCELEMEKMPEEVRVADELSDKTLLLPLRFALMLAGRELAMDCLSEACEKACKSLPKCKVTVKEDAN